MKDPEIVKLLEMALQKVFSIDLLNTDLVFMYSSEIQSSISKNGLREVDYEFIFDKLVFLQSNNSKEGELPV